MNIVLLVARVKTGLGLICSDRHRNQFIRELVEEAANATKPKQEYVYESSPPAPPGLASRVGRFAWVQRNCYTPLLPVHWLSACTRNERVSKLRTKSPLEAWQALRNEKN